MRQEKDLHKEVEQPEFEERVGTINRVYTIILIFHFQFSNFNL